MFSILVGIVRVLVILFLVRLALQGILGLFRRPVAVTPPGARKGTDLVRDRVCNTFLPRDRALRATIGGRDEHFCSVACRDRALAAFSQAS